LQLDVDRQLGPGAVDGQDRGGEATGERQTGAIAARRSTLNGVMDGDGLKLRIDLGVEPDADAAELDEATQQLRRELLELDVENVERPSAGPAPPGAPSALARSCY
jgi:hypothetical protein